MGDLTPGLRYAVTKYSSGTILSSSSYTASATGTITFTDNVTTGVTEFMVFQDL